MRTTQINTGRPSGIRRIERVCKSAAALFLVAIGIIQAVHHIIIKEPVGVVAFAAFAIAACSLLKADKG